MDEEDNALPPMTRPGGLGHALESTGATFGILLFFLFSSHSFIDTLLHSVGGEKYAAWTGILPAIPVVLSAIGGKCWRGAVYYSGYVGVAIVVVAMWSRAVGREWVNLLVVGWIMGAGWLLKDVLDVKVSATGVVGVWGVLTRALLLLDLFLVIRPLEAVGWDFGLTPMDWIAALVAALLVAGVSVPAAVLGRWSRVKRAWVGGIERLKVIWPKEVAILLGLYFAGLVEELLMRGVILNLLERWMGRRDLVPLLVGMLVSGVAHSKDDKMGYQMPNWRAATLAAVASVPYAIVWRHTGKVTASAVSNALMEYIWRTSLEKTAIA